MAEKCNLKPLPYYKWFWQDWRSNRTVQRMTYVDRGLYRELLDECWVEGSLPDGIEALAEICGCPVDVMANAWQVLGKCFHLVDGRLHNEKLDSLRTEKDVLRVARCAAGRKGGIRKALKEKEILASAKHLPDVASVCHIEEKRREEKNTPLTPLPGGTVADAPDLSVAAKPERKKRSPRKNLVTLPEYLDSCRADGVKPIPENDPIREWASEANIPDDYMRLAWQVFVRDWSTKKPQRDWPATFRDAVRRNWLKLWYVDGDGQCKLTTAGAQEWAANNG